ncbi:MAG: DUF4406 domain-containing protein [Gammaproteobacteria bacterium]|nr:DUF4406 domain-containing protein [Gammaproteobacteria bacterium]MBU2249592.1 DUF4406 domain-containing protein [Gammaproteobacteria bacterium]
MRIFIAGPYGDHNPKDIIAENVHKADEVARNLMAQGHQVYCPHKMSWGWEDDPRLTYAQFHELDNTFLLHWAEAIIRIPGHSPGADAEMALAEKLGLVIIDPQSTITKG